MKNGDKIAVNRLHAASVFPSCCPDHIAWSFGGKPWESPVVARSLDFEYWINANLGERELSSFREEVFNACRLIDKRRGNKTVALCYSGGIDSETIAIALHQLGIPFELYFLDIWGLNRAAFDRWSTPLLSKLGKKVHVVNLERSFFREEYAVKVFREFGIEFPTYIALTYLFEKIPENQFIVVGDGDFNRSGKLYQSIGKMFPVPQDSGIYFPFSTASVFYFLWAKKARRDGEFYFYSSTPHLITAMSSDPHFRHAYPESDTREVMYSAFPEVKRREKTTNWDGLAYHENIQLRKWLRNQSDIFAGFEFWRPAAGTASRIDISKPLPPIFREASVSPTQANTLSVNNDSLTICALPWSHVVFAENKNIVPCCSYQGQGFSGNHQLKSDILGNPYFSNLRKQMLRGEKPPGCAYCYRQESLSGKSKRTLANQRFPRVWLQKPKLRSLEFNLGNICNLKCRGCNSTSSIKWAQDEILLGKKPTNSQKPIRVSLQSLEQVLPGLDALKLLGGEPFLIPEHEEVLRLIQAGHYAPKLQLEYATNGTTRVSSFVLDIWRQLKGLEISFSIDGLRDNNDFFRDGSNWESVLDNMRWFRDNLRGDNVKFSIHTVVNIYNLHEISEIDDWLSEEFPEFSLTKDHLVNPSWLNICNFSVPEKQKWQQFYQKKAEEYYGIPGRRDAYLKIQDWLGLPSKESFSSFVDQHLKLNRIRGTEALPSGLAGLW